MAPSCSRVPTGSSSCRRLLEFLPYFLYSVTLICCNLTYFSVLPSVTWSLGGVQCTLFFYSRVPHSCTWHPVCHWVSHQDTCSHSSGATVDECSCTNSSWGSRSAGSYRVHRDSSYRTPTAAAYLGGWRLVCTESGFSVCSAFHLRTYNIYSVYMCWSTASEWYLVDGALATLLHNNDLVSFFKAI